MISKKVKNTELIIIAKIKILLNLRCEASALSAFHKFSWLVILTMFFSSCSVTKKLPAGESLYVGAKVNVVADSGIAKTEIKNVEALLTGFVKPKPNSSIFGFPYKVWFYYLFGEPKGDKGFKSFFRKRFGEPPVLASKSVTAANAKQIGFLLNNEGYFRSTATGELSDKNRKSTAIYTTILHQIGRAHV